MLCFGLINSVFCFIFNLMSLALILEHEQSFFFIVQELCESRGGRPGLTILTSLLVSMDVKIY